MMKTFSSFIALFIFFFHFENLSAQEKSAIYNDKGQLFLDTSLQINKDQLKRWAYGEKIFLNEIFKNLKYSPMAMDAGISGLVIISFEVDSNKLKNLTVIKKLGGGLEESTIAAISTAEKSIVRYLRCYNSSVGKYFLPVLFELGYLENELPIYKAIPIKSYEIPIVEEIICPSGPLKKKEN